MDRKVLFFFLGLIVLIIQCVHCVPAVDKKDENDYLNDDGDDYLQDTDAKDDSQNYDDEFEEDDKKASSTVATPDHDSYTTEERVEVVDAGKSVTLNCIGDNLDEATVYLWYKDQAILFQGTTSKYSVVTKYPRASMSAKDGSLTLSNVETEDDGEFRCRTYPTKGRFEAKIKVSVRGPPSNISIGHNQNPSKPDISNEKISYKVGEKDLRFRCNSGKAHPKAKVTWNHNGNAIQEAKDNDIKIIEDGILVFRSLHAKHSGKYECVATNEYGSIKAQFELDVQYTPFFTKHSNYFNTEVGNDVEISCLYRSSPAAKSVKWFKGVNQIHDSDKHAITADEKDHHDRTILTIKNVEKGDLTNYFCEVQNELGTKRENLTLGLVPSPPKYLGYKYINNDLFTDWLVKSHQELTSIQILFRNNETMWNTTNATITRKHQTNQPHEWKVQGSINLDAGEWMISARAKNTEGWSEDGFTQHAKIILPKDDIESGKSTSSASSVTSSTICGLIVMLIARYAV